jgi:hypothetical protein
LDVAQYPITGDWGDVDEYDRLENERSLVDGCRLLLPSRILMALRRHVHPVPAFIWGQLAL